MVLLLNINIRMHREIETLTKARNLRKKLAGGREDRRKQLPSGTENGRNTGKGEMRKKTRTEGQSSVAAVQHEPPIMWGL